MSETISQEISSQDEPIDMFELWEILWSEKFLILGVTFVFALGSVFYALAQIDIYRSEALLVSAEASQPINPLLAQLGAAAGFVSINAADNRTSQVTTAIAALQSREFIRQFILKRDLLPVLFAGHWNSSENRSDIDQSVYDTETRTWHDGAPSEQDAVRLFQSILSVSNNQVSGLVTIAIEWQDPILARDWVASIVENVNKLFKQQDLQEATSAIQYLQGQLQNTQLVEMQRAFYQLIESQTRIVMLADVRDDYVFKTVDPAFVPDNKIRPSRFIILIIGTLLGGTLSVILVFILRAIRERKKRIVT